MGSVFSVPKVAMMAAQNATVMTAWICNFLHVMHSALNTYRLMMRCRSDACAKMYVMRV